MKLDKRFWIIAIMILIFSSSIVSAAVFDGLKDKMGGFGGKITGGAGKVKEWQGKYFTKEIIANTLILAGTAYFLLMMLPKFFPSMSGLSSFSSYSYGNTSMWVSITVMVILSLVISINAFGPDKFMWEENWWVSSKVYLFGDKYCVGDVNKLEIDGLKNAQNDFYETDEEGEILLDNPKEESWTRKITKRAPLVKSAEEKRGSYSEKIALLEGEAEKSKRYCYTERSKLSKEQRPTSEYKASAEEIMGWGILRGARLFVFVGSILIYFLLFKVLSPQMDKSVRWILTIMFAANLAQTGMPKSQFLQVAYWVLLFLLYKTFAKTSGEGKTGMAMAWGLAFGVVNTMAVTAFGHYGIGLGFFPYFGGPRSFISNFVAGFIFGFIIGSVREGDKSFLKKGYDELKGAGWGKRAGQIGRGIWGTAKFLGTAKFARIPWARIKRWRAELASLMKRFSKDMKELRKLEKRQSFFASKTALSKEEQDESDLIRWGKGKINSRDIEDLRRMYNEFIAKLTDWVNEPDKGKKRILLVDMVVLEKKMHKLSFKIDIAGKPVSPKNPTYDDPKKNKDGYKSMNGILGNQLVEIDLENVKDAYSV